MDESLEDQVARAMYEAHAAHRKPWEQLPLRDKLRWRASARAAITITGEFCAAVAENPGFIEARDTEWDSGVNYAKRYVAKAIRTATSERNDS